MRKGRGNGGLWKARKTIVRCFPTFPQTLEIARKVHREIKNQAERFPHSLRPRLLAYVDFKSRKDKNPLRLPFAHFRLIFGLEKTWTSTRTTARLLTDAGGLCGENGPIGVLTLSFHNRPLVREVRRPCDNEGKRDDFRHQWTGCSRAGCGNSAVARHAQYYRR